MRILAVIPARFAAQRFPGKPLADIAGRPMVRWVYEAARRALPRVVVATDDARIVAAVKAFGGEAVMTSAACRSGTDRVAEVAKKMKADVYLNIQGDEPLMSTKTVKRVLALHKDRAVRMGTAATDLTTADWTDPNAVKALIDVNGDALYFSRAALPYHRDGAPASAPRSARLLKHLGIYSYRADLLKMFVKWPAGFFETAEKLEQLRAVERGVRIRVAYTPDDSVGVDRSADVGRVESVLLNRGAGDGKRKEKS